MREDKNAGYSVRREFLGNCEPNEITTDDKTQGNLVESNNPDFSTNMASRLNTPFDHIERIVLQDLSGMMHIERKDENDTSDNYFKTLFNFVKVYDGSDYGFNSISMSETDLNYMLVDYSFVNGKLSSGPFFLDSFTFSPMVDYSVSGYEKERHIKVKEDKRVGVYQDKFLTDYTTGKYDEHNEHGTEIQKNQVDEYRDRMTSTLFELGNLEKDIYDAKIAFRDSIKRMTRDENYVQQTDAKVYIETFCQHIATLFAKLSNIRMSHEVYGFKHPHSEWEGLLALDIWY